MITSFSRFLTGLPLLAVFFLSCHAYAALGEEGNKAPQPNIIFVLSDDLAQGDVGCYGQKIIQTPRMDRMAAEGTRYTQAYCGTSVCAPSRASLLTGLDMGHCPVRANREIMPEGQMPMPENAVTVAQLLKSSGYVTACIGKWGLGMFDTTGSPLKKGFDHFFGYNCQRHAHNYFPDYLYNDDKRFELDGKTYSQNLIQKDVLSWVRSHQEQPFFLYYAPCLPHGRYQIDDLGFYKDKPWPGIAKNYAAMVTRLDTDVGQLLDLLKELGLEQNTLVILSGDNGSSFGPDSTIGKLFGQADVNGLRGFKRELYEGGLRNPGIARWPGTIPAGKVRDEPWAFWDFLPTAVELGGASLPQGFACDGHSLVSFLKGGAAPKRDYFYWELFEGPFRQAIRFGDIKALRNKAGGPLEVYDLNMDVGEKNNIASTRPDLASKAEALMKQARVDDPNWPVIMPGKKRPPVNSAPAPGNPSE